MKSWLEFKLWICLRSYITAANEFNRITIQFTLVTAQDRWYLLLFFKCNVLMLCISSLFNGFQWHPSRHLLTIWNDCGKSPGQTWSVWRTSWLLWALTGLSLPGSRRARRQRRVLTRGTWDAEETEEGAAQRGTNTKHLLHPCHSRSFASIYPPQHSHATDEVRLESPWTMDDTIICSESRELGWNKGKKSILGTDTRKTQYFCLMWQMPDESERWGHWGNSGGGKLRHLTTITHTRTELPGPTTWPPDSHIWLTVYLSRCPCELPPF